MSAFIVCKEHIDALVTYMLDERMSYWTGSDRVYVTRNNASETGQILWDENQRSVNYRYNEQDEPEAYQFAHFARSLKPVEIIKAVHCLDYQSCETDDWESTMSWRICQTIISHACHRLPGYEQAEWGIYSSAKKVA